MNKILIAGKNSYVGTSFETWMKQHSDDYMIDTIDLKDGSWKQYDFSTYDTILHLAAIVHTNNADDSLYFKVNRDLAYEVALKAKEEGVKQFIFFSTMSVYGEDNGNISAQTIENPVTPYGKSKYEAEQLLKELANDSFVLSILRPPMIYGENSPGNYGRLHKLAIKTFIFPQYQNQRSMLYINNLHAFLKLIIDKQLSGVFYPQNQEYVCTSDMVRKIAEFEGKNIYFVSIFNGLVKILSKKTGLFSKVFGDLTYDYELPGSPNTVYDSIKMDYQIVDFTTGIRESRYEK